MVLGSKWRLVCEEMLSSKKCRILIGNEVIVDIRLQMAPVDFLGTFTYSKCQTHVVIWYLTLQLIVNKKHIDRSCGLSSYFAFYFRKDKNVNP